MRMPPVLKTPWGAAILSAIFPGLGQIAAGKTRRGIYFAIPTITLIAMIGLLGLYALVVNHDLGFNSVVNESLLGNLVILDGLLILYRIWAVVDAYMVARPPRKRFGWSTTPAPKANAALRKWTATGAVVLIVASLVPNVVVAKPIMDWKTALECLHAKVPCWVDNSTPDPSDLVTEPPDDTPNIPSGSVSPMPTIDMSSIPTFNPTSDAQNWAADGELNVMLLGLGVQKGGSASRLGPDTIMVLHASTTTGQAELISIGRNNYCTPLPTREIAANYPNPPYNCPAGTYGNMFFNLPNEILDHCARWPLPEYKDTCGKPGDENRYLRAYKGFEMTVGNLLGFHVDGSMWINPIGLTAVIDALGGVNITVGTRVYDKPCGPSGSRQQKLGAGVNVPGTSVCADTGHWGYYVPTGPSGIQRMKDLAAQSNGGLRVYPLSGLAYDVAFVINPGTYHMNGDWALAYARTRIYDPQGDFGRALRQQVLLTSLRKTLDPCKFASIGVVAQVLSVVQAIPYGFNTDLDITSGENLHEWANIAKRALGESVQQLVLTPQAVGMPKGVSYVAWDNTTIPKARALVQQYFQKSTPATPAPGTTAAPRSC